LPLLGAAQDSERAVQSGSTSQDGRCGPSDELLMSLVCQGDKEALALLFHRYARLVRGVAYRVLRDRSEADDLMQDIFLLINRLCSSFDSSKGSARTWILQMTYRRALCRRRSLTVRHFYQRLDVDELDREFPESAAGLGRFQDTIDGTFGAGKGEQAFGSLSEDQRRTLRLYFVEGYTLEEIAKKLGQSKGNVKHHYFRGIEKLRKQLLGGRAERETAV
jgi:RNA polymerase sigma-70 factor, ECF subfamily